MSDKSDNTPALIKRDGSKQKHFSAIRVLIISAVGGGILYWASHRSSYRDLAPGIYLLHDDDSTYQIIVNSSYDPTPDAPNIQGGAVVVKNVRSIASKPNVCIYGTADTSRNVGPYFLLELRKKNQDVDAEFFSNADLLKEQLRVRFGIQALDTTPAENY